jgi:hypothetical protein
MKKLILSLLVVTAFVAAPMSVFAEAENSANASGTAIILTPLTISKTTDLNFGTLAAGNAAGAAVVADAAAPALAATGGTEVISATNAAAAEFAVAGEASTLFDVSCGAISLGSLVVTPDYVSQATTDASGDYTLYVGGSLAVPANTAGNTYTGSFTVTVSYN